MSTSRETEVQVTHEFTGGTTPVWTSAVVYTLPTGTSDLMIPALGDTQYAVRTRVQDVFGNFSTWSTATLHTTAAGPDGIGFENRIATVTIDETGITIRDGALTIEDEYGSTVAGASGFEGGWAEFIATGLYNSQFAYATAGALSDGRTAALPYWTVSRSGSPTATVTADSTFPGGKKIRVAWAATAQYVELASDKVPVVGGFEYAMTATYGRTVVANSVSIKMFVKWYNASGSYLSSSTDLIDNTHIGTAAATLAVSFSEDAPSNAAYAEVHIKMIAGTYNAGNSLDLGGVSFRAAAIGSDLQVPVLSSQSVSTGAVGTGSLDVSFGTTLHGLIANPSPNTFTMTGSYTNWTPTDISTSNIIFVDPNGSARNIYSLVGGEPGQYLWIVNNVGNTTDTITLGHNNGTIADSNTKFLCPNQANYVIRGRAAVLVYKQATYWQVMGA